MTNEETNRINLAVHYKCQSCDYISRCPLPYAPDDTFNFRCFCLIRKYFRKAEKISEDIERLRKSGLEDGK